MTRPIAILIVCVGGLILISATPVRQSFRILSSQGLVSKVVQSPAPSAHIKPVPRTLAGCIDDMWTATSTASAPVGRRFHTAVWTGSEMIVWGGQDQSLNPLNTGARYNPSTDSWTPISTTNAPAPRSYQSAVWSGSEMIVWGGIDGNFNALNTGGRYDPVTDSWSAMIPTNPARAGHTALWTGSEMLVWGGSDTNTGVRYNPDSDSWITINTTNAPSARGAVWT